MTTAKTKGEEVVTTAKAKGQEAVESVKKATGRKKGDEAEAA